MSWKISLIDMGYALGDNPSVEQQENMLEWVIDTVPCDYWCSVADRYYNYKHFHYGLIERCAELGV